jgi:hypothetical protein
MIKPFLCSLEVRARSARERVPFATSGLQKNAHLLSVARMLCGRTICFLFMVLLFEACSVTEQTPADVGQKFEEGITGNGRIVPEDNDHSDHSQTGSSINSPATAPAGLPQP